MIKNTILAAETAVLIQITTGYFTVTTLMLTATVMAGAVVAQGMHRLMRGGDGNEIIR